MIAAMGVTRRAALLALVLAFALAACDTLFPAAPADAGDAGGDSGDGGDAGDGDHVICNNECIYSRTDYCDDGGRGAVGNWCAFGTDCDDCGARDSACVPFCGEPGAPWLCGWDECGGSCGACPANEYCVIRDRECVACSCSGLECGVSYCGEWCGDCAVGETCDWNLGTCEPCECAEPTLECGYDRDGCTCGLCSTGFCSNVTHLCELEATALCNDSCQWAGDDYCDDHGRGCSYAVCPFGSDCTDCGVRTETYRLHPDAPCPG
jgi:hypothetical protein